MAAKKKSKCKKNQQTTQDQDGSNSKSNHSTATAKVKGEDLIHIDPSRVRFQHSRIRPHFSGCGRSVVETLDEIRRGDLKPADLPPIQVLIGPEGNDGLGPWYFSLNNRRLWVLKQCYKEGLLNNSTYNNTIPVRVRLPKSDAELERYSVDNCALEAKFMREGGGSKSKQKKKQQVDDERCTEVNGEVDSTANQMDRLTEELSNHNVKETADESESSDCESDDNVAHSNPFSALM